jgi:hypothetical protein
MVGRKLMFLLAALLLLLSVAQAQESWEQKPSAEWTQEEALAVLNDSPWAHQVRLWQFSGRLLARLPNGRTVVYQDAPNRPSRQYSVPVSSPEPERVEAVYGVRWSSARRVQQALERLRTVAPVLREMQAPPPELSADHCVLTVRVVKPPTESGRDRFARATVYDQSGRPMRDEPPRVPDIFAGLSEEEVRDRTELRTSRKLRLRPERVLRHGLGTSEGISFFFPRQYDGQAVLPEGTKWVEFSFRSEKGDKLKARFKLADMQLDAQPDY